MDQVQKYIKQGAEHFTIEVSFVDYYKFRNEINDAKLPYAIHDGSFWSKLHGAGFARYKHDELISFTFQKSEKYSYSINK